MTTTTPTDAAAPAIDPKRAQAVLDEGKAELLALARGELQPVRTDLLRAVYTVLRVGKVASAERPVFERTFRDFPLRLIDNLDRDAFALWSAETEYRRLEAEDRGTQKSPPVDLVEQARELRALLLEAGGYVFRHDDSVRPVVADIRRGTGYLDLADDVKRLGELFTAHWPMVEGRCEVTRAAVDEAAPLAARLMDAIATPRTKQVSEWADLRVRAWTRLCRNYSEVRAAAAYIHRHEPDKLAAYPALHGPGGRKDE